MKLDIRITIDDRGAGFLKIEIPVKKDQTLRICQILTLREVLEGTAGIKHILTVDNRKLLQSHMF